MMRKARIFEALLGSILGALLGCSDPSPAAAPPPVPPASPPVEAEPAPEAADSDLACARVIVVSWQGATAAADTVTRSEDEARVRAEELLARIETGAARLDEVAREASDAASSGPRGGLLGTYERGEWPAAHEAIAARVFGMRVGEVSEVLHAPYGWVIAERCPVELAHTRHILLRFAGARNAPPEITRTREEARSIIEGYRAALASGGDFAALAQENSEDASSERGGDVGTRGRGRMAEAYEAAAFSLAEDQLSEVVETEFGFHVIQRLPL
jgi:parvulin-like peptidyl-prolyl isomerase